MSESCYNKRFEYLWDAFKKRTPPGVYLFLRGKNGEFEFYNIPKEQEYEEYWAILGWFDRDEFFCELHEAPEDYKSEFMKFLERCSGNEMQLEGNK